MITRKGEHKATRPSGITVCAYTIADKKRTWTEPYDISVLRFRAATQTTKHDLDIMRSIMPLGGCLTSHIHVLTAAAIEKRSGLLCTAWFQESCCCPIEDKEARLASFGVVRSVEDNDNSLLDLCPAAPLAVRPIPCSRFDICQTLQ